MTEHQNTPKDTDAEGAHTLLPIDEHVEEVPQFLPGNWSEADIAQLLREGMSRHGGRALPVMPWQSYARLAPEDAMAIARYLKRLAPNPHQAPAQVPEGEPASAPYVHVGLSQRR